MSGTRDTVSHFAREKGKGFEPQKRPFEWKVEKEAKKGVNSVQNREIEIWPVFNAYKFTACMPLIE